MVKKFLLLSFFTLICFSSFADEYDDEFSQFESEFSQNSGENIYDPIEPLNRKIFVFNDTIDRFAFEPLAKGYRNYVPKPIRKSVRNFTTNIALPVSVINSLAQGKLDNAMASFSHFLINSTIGVVGLFDVAGSKNIKYESEDFGQTLGHYGVKNGPFLILPIFGPSNARDAGGRAFDTAISITGFNVLEIGPEIDDEYLITNAALSGIDSRESLIDVVDDARKDSLDLYITMRSYYSQNRNSKINK